MQNLGDLLRDIHTPNGVSWWPPALGWWLVLVLCILVVAVVIFVLISFKHKAGVRVALKALDQLYSGYKKQHDTSLFIRESSVIMRRFCLTYYNRNAVAGLTGAGWLKLLDSGLKSKQFSAGIGKVFAVAPYEPSKPGSQFRSEVNIRELYNLCIKRIKSI